MKRKRHTIMVKALKYTILFTISAILVAGFWFHSTFYQYGLLPLLAVGGFVTLLIIVLTSKTLQSSLLSLRKPEYSMDFNENDRDGVLDGSIRTRLFMKPDDEIPELDSYVYATCGKKKLAVLYVTDVRRYLAEDIPPEVVESAGYTASTQDDEKSVRKRWTAGTCSCGSDPTRTQTQHNIVTAVTFEIETSMGGA